MSEQTTTQTESTDTFVEIDDPLRIQLGSCLCGCGFPTLTSSANYLPGHDARHAAIIARLVFEGHGADLLNTLPSPALQVKASRIASSLTAKAEQAARREIEREAKREAKRAREEELKATRAQRKADAKVAKAAAKEISKTQELILTGGSVKIGRWTYPAELVTTADGTPVSMDIRGRNGNWDKVEDAAKLAGLVSRFTAA